MILLSVIYTIDQQKGIIICNHLSDFLDNNYKLVFALSLYIYICMYVCMYQNANISIAIKSEFYF